RGHKVETGCNDGPGGIRRLHPDGAGHRHRRRNSEAAGHRRDRRADYGDVLDPVRAAGALSLGRRGREGCGAGKTRRFRDGCRTAPRQCCGGGSPLPRSSRLGWAGSLCSPSAGIYLFWIATLELAVEAAGEDVDRATVGIIGGVGDQLVVRRERELLVERVGVIGLQNALLAIVELAV